MIVLRRDPDTFRPATRGLLGWLHADGVLVLPAGITYNTGHNDTDDGQLRRDLQRATAQPITDPDCGPPR